MLVRLEPHLSLIIAYRAKIVPMADVFPAALDDLADWPVVDEMIAALFGTDA